MYLKVLEKVKSTSCCKEIDFFPLFSQFDWRSVSIVYQIQRIT